MKLLIVEMPDGSEWSVPAKVIAENRARHYADDPETTFAEEVEFALGDDFEIKDWAANNMNWSDVEAEAKRIESQPKPVDFQEGWCNGRKRVIEVPG